MVGLASSEEETPEILLPLFLPCEDRKQVANRQPRGGLSPELDGAGIVVSISSPHNCDGTNFCSFICPAHGMWL